MKKIFIPAVLLLCIGTAVKAQNLNPTVEVHRTYESSLKFTPKPVPAMALPDSLLKFDLDFDYSVFDKPYAGTGEFNPYLLDLSIKPNTPKSRSMYLKVGAGFSLHPELEFVYSPASGGNTQINLFASHKSYIGKYKYRYDDFKAVAAPSPGSTPIYVCDNSWTGYDAATSAGLNGRTGLGKGATLLFDAGYYGLMTNDNSALHPTENEKVKTSFNSFEASLGFRTRENAKVFFKLDASASVASDDVETLSDKVDIFSIGVDGSVSSRRTDHSMVIDFHYERDAYSGLFNDYNAQMAYVTPRYVAVKNGFRINLGVRFSYISASDLPGASKPHDSQFIYPDAHISYELVKDHADFFADVTGGDRLASYRKFKRENHFFNPMLFSDYAPLSGNSVEHINVAAGLRGNIGAAFRYEVLGGYRVVSDALFYGFYAYTMKTLVYDDMKEPYAMASFSYDRKPLLVEGNLSYRATSPDSFASSEDGSTFGKMLVKPRSFRFDGRALYYWKSRVCAGITANYASKAESLTFIEAYKPYLGSYLDLGLYGEYYLDRKTGVYAKVGNLLNSKIYDDYLMPRSGMYLTVGLIVKM